MENSGGSNNKVFEERSDISRLAGRNLNVRFALRKKIKDKLDF